MTSAAFSIRFLLAAGTLLTAVPGFAAVSGSTAVDTTVSGTVPAAADTIRQPKHAPALEDSVRYSADTIRFLIADEVIRLTGRASVRYQGIRLEAHTITLFSATRNMMAEGHAAVTDGDTVWTGTPVLTDKEGSVEGFRMTYNLESRRGRISRGNTAIEQGYYSGSTIALVGNKELNSSGGDYTTCALHEDPHYTFHSRRMKLYVNDKAILKPVTLTFQDIPVMRLPFFILPLKHKRHSGLLMPRYGEDNLYGKYLKNIGYYYAPSDYWDAKLAMGFYSSARNQLEAAFNYNRRYILNGGVAGSFLYDTGSAGSERNWDIRFHHSHELAPGWSMRASGEFESNRNYRRSYREAVEEISKRELLSTAYITRKGERTVTTVTATHTKTYHPDRTTTNMTLPATDFRASGQLFPTGDDRLWYRKLRYSYSNGFSQKLFRETDTTETDTAAYERTRVWQQNAGLNYSGTLLAPWLNVSPAISYNETYTQNPDNSTGQSGIYTLRTAVSTILYGMIPVNLFSLEVLRHTLTPSLEGSYARTLRTTDRAYVPLAAGTPDKPVRTLSVTLKNLFQAKINRDSTVLKPTLLTGPDISTSYDFDAERWADVRTAMYTSLGGLMTLNVRFLHSLYPLDSNRPLIADGAFPLRELSREVSLTTNGRTGGALVYYDDIRRFSNEPDYTYAGEPLMTVDRPWDLAANYRITHTVNNGITTKSQNLTGSAGFSLTRNLKAAYSATYDLENREFVTQRVDLVRDLHCWVAKLNWTPTGYRKGFYFVVRIREIPDVKVEQSIKYE